LKTKIDKTILFNKIIARVREQNSGNARFVKQTSATGWHELIDYLARDKVGHALREFMTPRYKARADAEYCQRQQENKAQPSEVPGDDMYEPLPVSSATMPLSPQLAGYFRRMKRASFVRDTSLVEKTSSFVAV
jgi:hypothetical protein